MTASQLEQILSLSPLRISGDEVWHGETLIGKIESASSWRIKYILQEDELLSQVDDVMDSFGGLAKFAWENSIEIDRFGSAIEAVREILDKSHEYVNEIFQRAKELEI